VVAQVLGASVSAAVLYLIATGKAEYSLADNGLAANGYADHSPGQYAMASGFLIEAVLSFFFVLMILGSTDRRAPAGFAPLAIGLALVVGGWALQQLWMFWVAPLLGGILGGLAYKALAEVLPEKPAITGEARPSS
jgi:aquaporin Z